MSHSKTIKEHEREKIEYRKLVTQRQIDLCVIIGTITLGVSGIFGVLSYIKTSVFLGIVGVLIMFLALYFCINKPKEEPPKEFKPPMPSIRVL